MDVFDHVWLIAATLGLCAVTFVTRSFFLLTPSAFVFPPLIQRALRFAPTAAITAVIAPEIFMQAGHVDVSWHNKALIACVIASIVFVIRQNLLLTIFVGMLVFTVLRLFGFGV